MPDADQQVAKEAPACRAALTEATDLWPQRYRGSDGILPSAAHHKANPASDHEGGNAFDLSHDPAHGVDCHVLSLVAIRDPRTTYVIWNHEFYQPTADGSYIRHPYPGVNLHTAHMHVSIIPSLRQDTSSWWGKNMGGGDGPAA